MLKAISKQDNSNLIDLTSASGFDNNPNSRLSVLETFDPLCTPTPKPVPTVATTLVPTSEPTG